MVPSSLLVLALGSAPAGAQPLSLGEALALAVVHHPDVTRSTALRDQAAAAVLAAQAAADPSLTASVGADTNSSRGFVAGYPSTSESHGFDAALAVGGELATGTRWSVAAALDRGVSSTTSSLGGQTSTQEQSTWAGSLDLELGQDLLVFLRATDQGIAARTARERLDQAELSLLVGTQAAVVEAAEAWWALFGATLDAQVAEAAAEEARALRAQTEAWYEVGEVARVEVDRVTAEELGAERDLLRARSLVRSSADDLAILVGLRPGEVSAPVGEERVWTVDAGSPDDVVRAVLDGNLELALAEAELGAATAAEVDAGDARWPTLDLVGSAGSSTLSEDAGDAFTGLVGEDRLPRASIGLELAVPLGGRATTAGRRDAAAGVAAERSQLSAARDRAEADALAALDGLRTAEQGLALAEARLEVARATEDGEAARVEEGVRRLDELLVARSSRRSAEADVVSARVELARAELALVSLEGRVVQEVVGAR